MSRAIPRAHYIRIDIESLPSGDLKLVSRVVRRFPRKIEEVITSRPYVRIVNTAGYVDTSALITTLEQAIRERIEQNPLF